MPNKTINKGNKINRQKLRDEKETSYMVGGEILVPGCKINEVLPGDNTDRDEDGGTII